MLPVLCGECFWLPLRGITRVSFSRARGPQETEIQSELQDEDSLFPRVGSLPGYAGNSGERLERSATEGGGGNFSFLPQTTWLPQTEGEEQIVGGASGGIASQGHISAYVTSRTTCAVCGWKLHVESGKDVKALLLSHGEIREVTHKLKRCGGKSCRTSHRYNFLWQCGEKMNSALPTDSLAAIFLSDCRITPPLTVPRENEFSRGGSVYLRLLRRRPKALQCPRREKSCLLFAAGLFHFQ